MKIVSMKKRNALETKLPFYVPTKYFPLNILQIAMMYTQKSDCSKQIHFFTNNMKQFSSFKVIAVVYPKTLFL
jgi:hypothetical protein